MGQAHGEVSSSATFRFGRVLAQKKFLMIVGSKNYQKLINIGSVTLPLNSGPKLSVGQWIACWSGLSRGFGSRGKHSMLSYHICHIYRTWESIDTGWGRGDFEVVIWGGKPKKSGTIFMGESDASRHHVKILIWHYKR